MKSDWSTDEVVKGLIIEKVNILGKDVYDQVGVKIRLSDNYPEEMVETFELDSVGEEVDFVSDV